MALHLPFLEPLPGGQTNPTGWVGYSYAGTANPIPGQGRTGRWIGFSCAACHAARVTYEYEPGGKRVSRIFNGIPNPDWKATFLALSGRTYGVSLDEELPLDFIRYDQPVGTERRIESGWGVRGLRFLDALGLINEQHVADDMRKLSKERVDKTLLIYNMTYFTKLDDGYYYWNYQKMRREYGILEFGLDPKDPQNTAHR
jgi:hypothetical protein